jgi:predicted Ser/Thr protein kinase
LSTKPAGASDPSEIAGRYQVVKKLGAGAFGTVYKAKDKLLGRMVAIKTIRLEGLAAAGASLEELLERFTREAQVSAQLKHPNIVTIYDIGNADGLTYLAMEFIDGVGLEKLIASEGRLTVERAASIGAQVADALDFAHKNSVVHRDIKPANIMIEAGDRVKVTDFGIAKVTNSGEHLTMTGSLLGTPSYMSPEQARGGELDGRSDLFAVGCVIYEMLAGKKAFRGDSITGLIFKIITEDPPPLRDIDADLPDEILRIIAKAMSKAPETRYQSGRELVEDLHALVRPGSAPTLRQTELGTEVGGVAPPPAAPTVVSSPTVGAAAPTKLVPPPAPPPRTVAKPPAASAPRPVAPAPPPPRAEARKSGGGAGLIIGLLAVAGVMVLLAAGGIWYFFLRDKGPRTADDVTTTTLGVATTQPQVSLTEPPQDTLPPQITQPQVTQPQVTQPPITQGGLRPQDTLPPPVTQPRETQPRQTRPPANNDEQYAFLDEEEGGMDGGEAGQRVSNAYRNTQGGQSSSLGTSRSLNARPRSPRNLMPNERPAVAVLRYLINAESAYQKRNGRYGSLDQLKGAGLLLLDVPMNGEGFSRRNYNFALKVEDDGFTATAMPKAMGGRPFHGTDSGFIMEGLE